jgi:hypothetical protein
MSIDSINATVSGCPLSWYEAAMFELIADGGARFGPERAHELGRALVLRTQLGIPSR